MGFAMVLLTTQKSTIFANLLESVCKFLTARTWHNVLGTFASFRIQEAVPKRINA